MRPIFAAAFASSLLVAPLFIAPASADTMKNCAANWKAMSAADKAKTTYKQYSTACLKGGAATAPAAAAAPAPSAAAVSTPKNSHTSAMAATASGAMPSGATGQCKDGSYTTSKKHSGACSHHGGVAKWL